MSPELIAQRIRSHEYFCGKGEISFEVVKVRMLADGIVVCVDTEKEYTLYFDKKKYILTPGSIIQAGIPISGDDLAFGVFSSSASWDPIISAAKRQLKQKDGSEIDWPKTPQDVSFVSYHKGEMPTAASTSDPA